MNPSDAIYHPMLALAQITPSPTNPRKRFDAAALAELTDSIKAKGVLQPVIVRPNGKPDAYELVVGERRYRACKAAGLATIPATVRTLTDIEVLEIQIIENDQREDVHPLEEAEGYERLLRTEKSDGTAHTPEDIMRKIGKSRTYIYNRLKLLDLCAEGRTAFFDGTIDASKAQMIARLGHHDTQRAALKDLTKPNYRGDVMSVREAREHLERQYMLQLKDAPFDTKIADFSNAKGKIIAGACGPCPKRSGNNPDLFGDVKGADVCTDVKCFHAKRDAAMQRQEVAFVAKGLKVITGAEAKKILPNQWDNNANGDFVAEHQYCHGSNEQYGELIGKSVTPIMVRKPDSNEFVKVFPLAEVNAALKNNPLAATKKKDPFASNNAATRAKQELDTRVRKEAYLAVRARLATGLAEEDWRRLAVMAFNEFWDRGSEMEFFFGIYAPDRLADDDDAASHKTILDHIATMRFAALPRFLFDVAHHDLIAHDYGSNDDHEALEALFARYNIDSKAVRARLVAEDKAKAKAETVATKPSKPVTPAIDPVIEPLIKPAKKSAKAKK